MEHRFKLRVYYEDTDLAGIVYYANYLKFIERARSELLRKGGLDQMAFKAEHGIVFAVRRLEADYLQAAVLDDELCVVTSGKTVSGARMLFRQEVMRGDQTIFTADVTVVALRENGRPAPIPAKLRSLFD